MRATESTGTRDKRGEARAFWQRHREVMQGGYFFRGREQQSAQDALSVSVPKHPPCISTSACWIAVLHNLCVCSCSPPFFTSGAGNLRQSRRIKYMAYDTTGKVRGQSSAKRQKVCMLRQEHGSFCQTGAPIIHREGHVQPQTLSTAGPVASSSVSCFKAWRWRYPIHDQGFRVPGENWHLCRFDIYALELPDRAGCSGSSGLDTCSPGSTCPCRSISLDQGTSANWREATARSGAYFASGGTD